MKKEKYQATLRTIKSLIENEFDLVSVMSTISCDLYHAFDSFIWVDFYRLVDESSPQVQARSNRSPRYFIGYMS
jgi:putative methionine-R-sulfoxide reductase with GAF domain